MARTHPMASTLPEPKTTTRDSSWLSLLAQLTKARITVFVMLTAATGYILAAGRLEWVMLLPLAGVYLLAAGASALNQVQEAVSTVQRAAHAEANIIFGAVVEDDERPDLQVTVIAAGFSTPVSGKFLRETPAEMPASLTSVPEIETPAESSDKEEASSPPQPEGELLFPDEDPEPKPAPPRPEPEEDLSIPAFMRRRKRS